MSERKGYTVSDLEKLKQQRESRGELLNRVGSTVPASSGYTMSALPPGMGFPPGPLGPLWLAMERQDPIQDGADWRGPGITIGTYGGPVTIARWTSSDSKPEPPQPSGRFRNLDL